MSRSRKPYFKIQRTDGTNWNGRYDIDREDYIYSNYTEQDAIKLFNRFLRCEDRDDEYERFQAAYTTLFEMGCLTQTDCEKIVTRWEKKHRR